MITTNQILFKKTFRKYKIGFCLDYENPKSIDINNFIEFVSSNKNMMKKDFQRFNNENTFDNEIIKFKRKIDDL